MSDEPAVNAEDVSALDSELLAANVVRAVGVTKTYHLGGEVIRALRGVTLSIKRGEYVSIMGPSGSGKSTFFNMVGGLDKPNDGHVFIDEVDIASLDTFELAWLRCHKIGYIFQTFNLIPVQSALENVMLPMLFAGIPEADAQDKAAGLLNDVGLGHRMLNKPPQLSGGQQQRVAVARALANDPAIILADEPTGNLDVRTGEEIIDILSKLKEEKGVTVITATHDHKMLSASDRVIYVVDGQIDRVQKREDLNITVGTIEEEGHEEK
ncbi:MAG: ABC transporter ATP-binding protein [Lentisphaerae bacterium]|jgi:putative ABC transport system ATP-binding protein|nr:ABC transporter ATP-binding protein [Lentisphaerota bacterium]MBT4816657.1 ABC transporter ATP-binding protein [Lentisphaerota bacterium]MBT5606386.1 ABC transporter ATP-binding protein [Lentisphaerota bacterium]MBT7056759.1 ABC transporter ATP-binding protein [Lentisphaerota bacterium]MBT7840364.1 ABC transporter ATP-binding protein [Lentisphaerota bacterium]